MLSLLEGELTERDNVVLHVRSPTFRESSFFNPEMHFVIFSIFSENLHSWHSDSDSDKSLAMGGNVPAKVRGTRLHDIYTRNSNLDSCLRAVIATFLPSS